MEVFLLFLFWFLFGIINLYILYQDISFKKIPNIGIFFLGILLIFGYIFGEQYNFSLANIPYLLGTLSLAFACFYFGIWGAGDAKYLSLLSFYIPGNEIIFFIGNIAAITLLSLGAHAVSMYSIKSIFSSEYRKSLWRNIYTDLREKGEIQFKKKSISLKFAPIIQELSKMFFFFIIAFTFFRLLRIYLIQGYQNNALAEASHLGQLPLIMGFTREYGVFITCGVLISIFFLFRYLRIYLSQGYEKIALFFHIPQKHRNALALLFLCITFLLFLFYEYTQDAPILKENLIKILTFYIFLWGAIKILLYLYYVTFQLQEIIYKPIFQLHSGDTVDISFLVQMFGTQSVLGYQGHSGKYSPDPKIYFESIENPLSQEQVQEIQDLYEIVNTYHLRQNTPGYETVHAIKVLKTFSFGPYIFFGALLTLLFGNKLLEYIFLKISGILIY